MENGTITTIDFDDPKDLKIKTEQVINSHMEKILRDDKLFGSGETAKEIVDILESAHLI